MSNQTATQPNCEKPAAKRRQPPFAVRLGSEANCALTRLAEDIGTSKTAIIRTAILDAKQRHAEQRNEGMLESIREMAIHLDARLEALVSILVQVEIDLTTRLAEQTEALRSIKHLSEISAMRLQAVVGGSSDPRFRERAENLISQSGS